MPVQLSLNAEPTLLGLQRVESELRDNSDLWDRLEERVLRQWFQVLFESGGFGTWIPNQRDNPTGIDTGRLLRSYTNPLSPDNISRDGLDTFTYGTEVEYAIFFEELRPIVELLEDNPEFQFDLEQETQVYVDEVVRSIF